jgi:hypothetical protein
MATKECFDEAQEREEKFAETELIARLHYKIWLSLSSIF